MSILRAIDLTEIPSAEPLWRVRGSGAVVPKAGTTSELATSLGLPPQGFASPLGYWFAPEDGWATPPPYFFEILTQTRRKARSRAEASSFEVFASESRRRVVVSESRESEQSLELSVDGHSARLELDEAEWPEAREAGLLAVATCWRLDSLDRRIDRMSDQARSIMVKGGRPALPWRRIGHPLCLDLSRECRTLLLDLPEFEGPLTDPSRFVRSPATARLYRRLSSRLALKDWRDRIDERAEVLEGILDSIDSRREHRQVMTLEILIVAILAADVVLSLYFGFWG